MSYKRRILPTAKKDIRSICKYLESFSPSTRKNFLSELRNQMDLLTSGVVDYGVSHLPELAALGYHTCLVSSYVMLYYIDGDELVIAHIFHQTQNYTRLV